MTAMTVEPAAPAAATATRPRLEIDTAAVAANVRHLARSTDAALMAVVKADGFGHGSVEVARAALANGATWLGVTSLDEALVLRQAGLLAPILSWLNPIDVDARSAAQQRIDLALSSVEALDAVAARASHSVPPLRVHLQLDTGLARDGAAPHTWPALIERAGRAERAGLMEVVGVMGHLPCADEPEHPTTRAGLHDLLRGVALAHTAGLRPQVRHLAATAAVLTAPDTHLDLVRVGAGLVGIDPSGTTNLAPALRLTAPVVQVRDVAAGQGIGYGHRDVTDRPTRLGLLPVGYADGLPRVASGRAEVSIRGRRHRLRGRISMDQVVVDLGDEPIHLGETVVVLGPGDDSEPTVEDWARWSDTIPHEIVTGLGARLERTIR